MTPEEALPILTRWLAETQTTLKNERETNEKLAQTITQLEHQVSGFAYWMRTAKTPAQVRQLAADIHEVG